jgi:hypothetical protein
MVGHFIKKCFAGNTKELDRIIATQTSGIPIVKTVDKPGKKDAYPIGTVVKVQEGENVYFCVAQTDVDEEHKSKCSVEMLHKAVIAVLNFVNREANERDVYMPLLGSGFSRIDKSKQVNLEYLISIVKMAELPIKGRLHIVLLEKDREFFDLIKAL